MNFGPEALDLIVLAADKHIAVSVKTLLRQRRADLGIRAVSFEVRPHPESDPGCRTKADEFLRPLIRRYRYALVVFDHAGCSSQDARREVQRELERVLGRNGWTGRSKVILSVAQDVGPYARSLRKTRDFLSETGCGSSSLPVRISHTR